MSQEPLTDAEVELIRLEADRHWKAQADDTLRLVAGLRAAQAQLNEATQRIITSETELADVEEALYQARAAIARVEALCADEEATHKPGRARYAVACVKDIRAALAGAGISPIPEERE